MESGVIALCIVLHFYKNLLLLQVKKREKEKTEKKKKEYMCEKLTTGDQCIYF